MIAWSTVQSAIRAWAVSGSGLPSGQVIWGQQSGPRPAQPWISLRVMSVRKIGQDTVTVADASSPSAGAEIEITATGQRDVTLEMQCFGLAGQGANAPVALLEGIAAAASLPVRRDALNTAGIGLLGIQPITSIDGLTSVAAFEPRGIMLVRLLLSSEVSEFATYIETVEIEDLTTGNTFEVP